MSKREIQREKERKKEKRNDTSQISIFVIVESVALTECKLYCSEVWRKSVWKSTPLRRSLLPVPWLLLHRFSRNEWMRAREQVSQPQLQISSFFHKTSSFYLNSCFHLAKKSFKDVKSTFTPFIASFYPFSQLPQNFTSFYSFSWFHKTLLILFISTIPVQILQYTKPFSAGPFNQKCTRK